MNRTLLTIVVGPTDSGKMVAALMPINDLPIQVDRERTEDWATAQASTVPDALRALAEYIEQRESES